MAVDRFEVRLRRNNAREAQLLSALEQEEASYGGLNGLMRDCLLRGYARVRSVLESMPAGDAHTTINTLAGLFPATDAHRVALILLRALRATGYPLSEQLDAAIGMPREPSATGAPAARSPPRPIVAEPLPASATASFAPVVETPASTPSSSEGVEEDARDDGKFDWSRFRGIAGSQ